MMRSMLCLLIFVAGSSLAHGSTCPNATANSTAADINIVWVCEQLNYRTALAEWKKRVEENCNITEAEEYWREVFTCPDFSALSCLNDDARLNESDSFNCSLTVCSDGLYTDQTAFVDIWRELLDDHKTIMSIYASKLIHCVCEGRTCEEYNTTQFEVWNNVYQKYSDISMAYSTITNQMKQLESKSAAWDGLNEKYSELSNGLNETSQLIAKLESQTEAWSELSKTQSEMSNELVEAKDKINQLQNQSIAWEAQSHKYSELSSALMEASEQIKQLESKSEAWDAHDENYSELLMAISEAKQVIEQLHNNSGAWDNQTQKYSELSNAMSEVNKQIQTLENRSAEWDIHTAQYSELSNTLLGVNGRIQDFENRSLAWDALTQKHADLSAAVLEAKEQIQAVENQSVALDAHEEKYSELSATVSGANEQIKQLENRSERWDAVIVDHSELSDEVIEAKDQIQVLQSRSATWDALGLRYSELSASMNETNEQIQELGNDSKAWNAQFSMNLTETNEQITELNRTAKVLTAREQNLTDELEASKQKIAALEIKAEFCVLKYDGKCFRVEVDYNKMNFGQAKEKCTAKGAKLANIYSKEHYYMLMGYLRTLIADDEYINAWLGMNFVSSTQSVTLSDGTSSAPFLKWHPGFPNSGFCCSMILKASLSREDQDMHNAEDQYIMRAAICEL